MSQPKITLQEAMNTLTNMFPSFDEGTIKSVLYQTNGHMERTIELLLGMVPEGGDEMGANQSRTMSSSANQQQPSQNTSTTIQHTLDDNFLRYSNLNGDGSNTGNYYDEQSDAPLYSEDEIYAYRLQKSLYEQGLSSVPPPMPGIDESIVDPTPSRNQNPNIRRDVDSGYSSRGIGSHAASSSSQTSFTFDQLSDFAKKKFADFKKRFTSGTTANRNNTNTNPEQDKEEERMRTGLLGHHDDDDENDRL
ncbi:hypothetical protein FDP41_009720 [Naegleria fowleri]|uniref:CUE domain-containing protein n=1 Tax=Naegleria fowleri TaxID=5763 RepID=A0A6A5BD66_NAEFO|nr:uncharacterized protein FDP41_009720 [Naegleria fowleri]KAF0972024.1 hypothetical protein FDP41_009720 [Naegleria fowleri]CAG4713604.1 unnamed protein product [Naegleria fowleri]